MCTHGPHCAASRRTSPVSTRMRERSPPRQILLGVFDGHGNDGSEASNFVKKNIAEELKTQMAREKYKFDFKVRAAAAPCSRAFSARCVAARRGLS